MATRREFEINALRLSMLRPLFDHLVHGATPVAAFVPTKH
jgi:hypothetical protein